MRKILLAITLLGATAAAYAVPTNEQYQARVRAIKLFQNEAKSIQGLSEHDAENLSEQVLKSLKIINKDQLAKGMSCGEIQEFIHATLSKNKTQTDGINALVFKADKFQQADCAIQQAWMK
ncbi:MULTISPECIES: hypothetical protein [Klebsiella pneumoniae complex]|nr:MULTISPECIES: hypothetical protein [Klebsiella]MDA5065464.1 hypothetical protein [Klebsiella pneumoniae]PLE93511.1 hypothetical protein B6I81_07100 [Klebsiella pneumoniae]PLF30374.1 hypothetical protein B6I89_09765 [Klebsiella pneumoniae]PLF49804.1 hypothetical protein B6I94_22900 [Klebsiella pneumoniae]PLF60672.1 hypothetical protein B6I93_11730 [Klebsiella pneumoniae]